MATNHLIIGLGGTGGKIIREFRKRYFEENKDLKPHNNVFVEYLYVDSSEDDLNEKKKWKVLGADVSLSSAQKVSTHGISLSMLSELEHYPHLNSFIHRSDLSMIKASLGKLIDAGIGGQRRRLGRILFAHHVKGERGFLNALEGVVTNLREKSKTSDVHFHVVAGLAGGTGSGSIVDTIAQIRKKYEYSLSGTKFPLHLYLYVPEKTIANISHNAGFYQSNGFAALSELNAISIGAYNPVDVSGEKNPDGTPCRIESDSPFEAAYLFSNTNENGHILDLGLGIPKMVADFIYQKTVGAGDSANGKMRRLETSENSGCEPEIDILGHKVHSRKFLSFGLSRIVYPETEIQEYMAYRHAQQGTLQMLYRRWEEGIGFGEASRESIGVGLNDKIRSKETRERFKLSDRYLKLSSPIVETETSQKWRDLFTTWNDLNQYFVGKIMEEKDRKEWLASFVRQMNDFSDSGFRTYGVNRFYEIQEKERVKYAKEIVRNIERHLFDQWSNGEMSVIEAEEYLSILEEDCRERMNCSPKERLNLDKRMKNEQAEIKSINEKWNNLNFINKMFKSKPENVFRDFANAITKLHIIKTEQIALDYELSMLTVILQELQMLKEDVKDFTRILRSIHENVTEEASKRCTLKDSDADINLKQYNREAIVEMTDNFVRNKTIQRENAAAIRSAIIKMLGAEDSRKFSNISQRIGLDSITDTILTVCSKTVAEEVEKQKIENDRYKVLNVNILEKLEEELNTEEKLKAFVENVVKSAKTFLEFDSQEEQKASGGKVAEVKSMIQLSLPEMPDGNNDFRTRFIDAFAEAYPGFNPTEDVSVNSKSNEIVVVSAKSGFPLRHIANVKTIREAYNRAILNPLEGEMNKYVLHTESFEEDLPSLYEMSREEIGNKFLSTLLLAKAMKIICESQSSASNVAKIKTQDDKPDVYLDLGGTDFISNLDTIKSNLEYALKIEDAVRSELKNYLTNDRKQQLRKAVSDVLNEYVLPAYGNNPTDPGYKKAQAEINNIFDNQLKLL